MGGWIKLHRSIQNNWIWFDEPFSKGQAWVDLLMLANKSDVKKSNKDEIVTYRMGTVNRSILSLADRWKWDRKKVRRFLSVLERDGMVSVNGTTHGTTITIENYGFFQNDRSTNGTTDGTTSGQPMGQPLPTNKNNKNKENKDNNTLDEFFDKLWSIYPRKVGKGKVSASKKKKLYSIGYDELERCVERYTRRIEMERIDSQFVMHGSTFFNSGYVDYLDKNYKTEQPLPFTETEEETVLDLWEDD